jgi:hypothetical protein
MALKTVLGQPTAVESRQYRQTIARSRAPSATKGVAISGHPFHFYHAGYHRAASLPLHSEMN